MDDTPPHHDVISAGVALAQAVESPEQVNGSVSHKAHIEADEGTAKEELPIHTAKQPAPNSASDDPPVSVLQESPIAPNHAISVVSQPVTSDGPDATPSPVPDTDTPAQRAEVATSGAYTSKEAFDAVSAEEKRPRRESDAVATSIEPTVSESANTEEVPEEHALANSREEPAIDSLDGTTEPVATDVAAEALSRVSSRDAAAQTATPPPSSPGRSMATPPTPGVSAAGKKFASSLTVNKKFMDKLGPEAKAAAISSLNRAPASAGKGPAATSPTASTSASASLPAGPRLLTGKLSSALPAGTASGQWARGTNIATGSFLAFQPAAGRGAPAARGRGKSARSASGDVWGRQLPLGESDAHSQMGKLQHEFPTAAEAAKSKQLKATAIAAANAAKENASRQAAQAAEAAAAAYNQHLLETLDGFRGLHLDPNASHWDEMEDDDIGDFVDFGDGAQYKLEDKVDELLPQDLPVAPLNEFDRGRASAPNLERRLFNANLNKLESVAPKREAPLTQPQPSGVLKKARGNIRATSPGQVRDRDLSPVVAKGEALANGGASQTVQSPVARPKLPPAPSQNPWAKTAEGTPPPIIDATMPTLSEAVALPLKTSAATVPSVPAAVSEPSAEPATPQVGSKEFEQQQELNMREKALAARRRREEEREAEEAAKRERLAKKLAELTAKSPPPGNDASVSSLMEATTSQTSSVAEVPKQRRPSVPSQSESWRSRLDAVEKVPTQKVASDKTLTEPAAKPQLAERVQLLRKPIIVAGAAAPAPGPSTGASSKAERSTDRDRRPPQASAERELFWRRAVPELAVEHQRPRRNSKVAPLPPSDLGQGIPPPVGHRAVSAKGKKKAAQHSASSPPVYSASHGELNTGLVTLQDRTTLDDTMARVRAALDASKQPASEADLVFVDLVAQTASKAHATVKLPGGSDERARPPQSFTKYEQEALATAAILEFARDSVWRTYNVRLAKPRRTLDVLSTDALDTFWARSLKDRRLEVVSWSPPSSDWSPHRLDRDRGLFKDSQPFKGRTRRPPRVHVVPSAAAMEFLAARAFSAGDALHGISTAFTLRGAADGPPAQSASKAGHRTRTALLPDLSSELESSLFEEDTKPATIRLALPVINGQAMRSINIPRSRRSLRTGSSPDLVDIMPPLVKLPGSARKRPSASAGLDNIPIPPTGELEAALLADESGNVGPLLAALVSSDEESLGGHTARREISATPPLPSNQVPGKGLPRMGGLSDSVHAAPFAPSTPLQDTTIKSRAAPFSSPTTWSPATASNTSFSIIDPHLKNVWGPSDGNVDVHVTSLQENSLRGIVDDLPSASMPTLNDLKSDDGMSASPTIETTMAHASAFEAAPIAVSRDASVPRASAAEALAAVGGLPFGRYPAEDDYEGTGSAAAASSFSPPPQMNAASSYYQPFYSTSPPTSMQYGLVSLPVAMGGGSMGGASPWLLQQPAGIAARAAYGAVSPDGYQHWPPQGHAYAIPASYKSGAMRSNSRPPIGSGRPGGNAYRTPSMPLSSQMPYEAYSSSTYGSPPPLPGAVPLSVRSVSNASAQYARQPSYAPPNGSQRWA